MYMKNQICKDQMFYLLDKLKPNMYIKLKTKTQNDIGIFHKK